MIKRKKYTFLCLLAALSGISLGTQYNPIHKVTVKIGGRCCPDIYLSTKVGKLKDDQTCQYLAETQSTAFQICGQKTFNLDGEMLRQSVGEGYECGASHAVLNNSTNVEGFDPFNLIIRDDAYAATLPFEGTILLNYECP